MSNSFPLAFPPPIWPPPAIRLKDLLCSTCFRFSCFHFPWNRIKTGSQSLITLRMDYNVSILHCGQHPRLPSLVPSQLLPIEKKMYNLKRMLMRDRQSLIYCYYYSNTNYKGKIRSSIRSKEAVLTNWRHCNNFIPFAFILGFLYVASWSTAAQIVVSGQLKESPLNICIHTLLPWPELYSYNKYLLLWSVVWGSIPHAS